MQTDLRYMTVSECIRANAIRHHNRGDHYARLGMVSHAAGSWKKAIRNYNRADSLTIRFTDIAVGKNALLRRLIDHDLMNGHYYG